MGCKKTKMKQRLIEIWKILLLTAIPNYFNVEGETSLKEENNEVVLVNFVPVNFNILVLTNRISLSRKLINLLYLKTIFDDTILLYNESYI